MELKKGISFFGVFSIASGAMISSGIFILPGLAFSKAGPAVFVSYFIAGVLGLLGIFSLIELATAMPKAGGDYYFINKTFGPLMGTISGFLGWFSLSLKSAFAIFGLSEIIYLYTGFSPLLSGLILCMLFVFINIIGVKEAAIFQIVLVSLLLTLMLAYVVIGTPEIKMSRFTPFLTGSPNQILITAGFVFISFGGLLNVANISEEVKNPKRNIPAGIISSIVVVTIFYTLITFIITGTLDAESFKTSLTPVADSARKIFGDTGYIIILVASSLAFVTTANAGIMAASRYPMALSRDKLLPAIMSSVNKKFKTPTLAIIFTGIIIYLSLLLPLEMLVKAASTVILTSYVLTNISVIILRESGLSNYRPSFKAPLYPWLQLASIALFSFFIVDLGREAMEISLALLFLSFCLYFFYGRKLKNREFALLHYLKKITDKRLLENTLEDELRDILINRDNIEQDSFDQLLRNAKILDFDKKLDFNQLLEQIKEDLALQSGLDAPSIMAAYQKRQTDSNTAVSSFLAIPHVILDMEEKVFMLIVRSKEGIYFTEEEPAVKAVFLLGGSKDKRLLHLRTLSSIASLVGQKDFEADWLKAKNTTSLKNLLLLSQRQRYPAP